jgi:hypothetical protein
MRSGSERRWNDTQAGNTLFQPWIWAEKFPHLISASALLMNIIDALQTGKPGNKIKTSVAD